MDTVKAAKKLFLCLYGESIDSLEARPGLYHSMANLQIEENILRAQLPQMSHVSNVFWAS